MDGRTPESAAAMTILSGFRQGARLGNGARANLVLQAFDESTAAPVRVELRLRDAVRILPALRRSRQRGSGQGFLSHLLGLLVQAFQDLDKRLHGLDVVLVFDRHVSGDFGGEGDCIHEVIFGLIVPKNFGQDPGLLRPVQ
jgi:hypothetical protein